MTFAEYLNRVLTEYAEHKQTLRYGQVAFNVLHEVKPDLANEVRGSFLDPFYTKHAYEVRMFEFFGYVEKNWED